MPERLTGIEEVDTADNGVASKVDIKDDGAAVDAESPCGWPSSSRKESDAAGSIFLEVTGSRHQRHSFEFF
jgi:hypothetical protein